MVMIVVSAWLKCNMKKNPLEKKREQKKNKGIVENTKIGEARNA